MLKQGRAEDLAPADAAKDIMEMLEMFENEPAALRFMSGIFGDVTARARAAIADFDAFDMEALGDIAHLGVEVLNRVRGLTLAEQALRGLYQRYLQNERPEDWKRLFKEATRTAYNLKYMFRESMPMARQKFMQHLELNLHGRPQQVYRKLVEGAFEMYQGLVDQETLATTDFLTNPQSLVKVVLHGVAGGDARVKLLGEIAVLALTLPPTLTVTLTLTVSLSLSQSLSLSPTPTPTSTPTPTPTPAPTQTRTPTQTSTRRDRRQVHADVHRRRATQAASHAAPHADRRHAHLLAVLRAARVVCGAGAAGSHLADEDGRGQVDCHRDDGHLHGEAP